MHRLEERMCLAMMATKTGTWEYDLVNKSLDIDLPFYNLFELTSMPEKPKFSFLSTLLASKDKPLFEDFIHLLITQSASASSEEILCSFDFNAITPKGNNKHIHLQCQCFFGENSKVERIIGVCSDTSELHKSHQLLARKNSQEEYSAAQHDQLAHVKPGFVNHMSHELKTPMNALMGALQMLKQYQLAPDLMAIVELANESSENLLKVINTVLEFSQLDDNNAINKGEEVNVKAMIEGVIHAHKSELNPNVKLFAVYEKNIPERCYMQAKCLRQIVNTLVSNAVKFTHVGEVNILVDVVAKNLVLSVRDTGIGMNNQEINSVFTPFTKADSSSKKAYSGIGLGLAICQKLVGKLGGTIKVQSVLEKGSVFTLNIPLLTEYKERISGRSVNEQNIKV